MRTKLRSWTPKLTAAACMAVLLGAGMLLAGCPPMMKTLTLSLSGLEALGGGYVYEGWLIVDGSPVSTGRFTIDSAGMLSRDTFMVKNSDADAASAFVLTIEPGAGDVSAPSDTHVIAGDFLLDSATLTVAHGAAFGDDFSAAAGSYILNTPTTTTDEDYDQGIWWLEVGLLTMTPSLTLQTLPEGWSYEGWVVGDDGPVSTGKFLMASGADSDGAGPTSGTEGFPAFPGQDFITPPMVLPGGAAVISIEPEPDDSPAPFAFKPLVDTNIEDVGIGVSQDMTNNVAATVPSGMAVISE